MIAPQQTDWLALSDEQLLAGCDVHTYKSSGPGGQHRNKVSSAVRLRHRPTGISAHGDDSRSQHENKQLALRRLRMNIALQVRTPLAPGEVSLSGPGEGASGTGPMAEKWLPPVVRECLFIVRGGPNAGTRRLEVGRKDHRFWAVAQFVLDVLEAHQARLSDAAACLGITTGNLSSLLKDDRHLFAAAQELRKRHGQSPLK